MTSRALREARSTFQRLGQAHPDAHCELDHKNPFELIVATVLSAQTTDVAVNKLTPALFKRWPNARALAGADRTAVEEALNRIGMFRQKAKNVIGLSQRLVEQHDGRVPETLEDLVKLPGVGRKTANVVLGVAFGRPEGVVVDTHVGRIAQRLGWTQATKPEDIEQDLMRLFPREDWDLLGHTLIFQGRRICTARNPACAACPVSDVCPSAFNANDVGRKPARARPRQAATPGKRAAKPASRAKPKRAAKPASRAKPKRAAKPKQSAASRKTRARGPRKRKTSR